MNRCMEHYAIGKGLTLIMRQWRVGIFDLTAVASAESVNS